ncbi:uncharacterized protein V1516DRAFT_681314 [Lipomyces oligophaga]|uniref:uncharacterized protein n=1 Tax=Lipomyces oligophaga TaxID=45792 RepID=UPI0034CD6696
MSNRVSARHANVISPDTAEIQSSPSGKDHILSSLSRDSSVELLSNEQTTRISSRRVITERIRQEPETEEVFDIVTIGSDTPSAISVSSSTSVIEKINDKPKQNKSKRKRSNYSMGSKRKRNGDISARTKTKVARPKNTAISSGVASSSSGKRSREKVPSQYLDMVHQYIDKELQDNSGSDSSLSASTHNPSSRQTPSWYPRRSKGNDQDIIDLERDLTDEHDTLKSAMTQSEEFLDQNPRHSAHYFAGMSDSEDETKANHSTPMLEVDSQQEQEIDDENMEWEDVEFGADEEHQSMDDSSLPDNFRDIDVSEPSAVEFTVGEPEHSKPKRKSAKNTREERLLHITIHLLHLVCLMCHGSTRSRWCNDSSLQEELIKYVPVTIVDELHPDESLPVSQKTRKLLDGLRHLMDFWNQRFRIIYKGMQRRQWDDIEGMKQEQYIEPPLDMDQFKQTLFRLEGSRDVGAQGFCAILRALQVKTRLIFSLQPLQFGFASKTKKPSRLSRAIVDSNLGSECEGESKVLEASRPRTLARLRKPRFNEGRMAYTMSEYQAKFEESRFPVFWVEVWDDFALQWIAIDPMVMKLIEIPRSKSKFEPPQSDTLNVLSYAIAFDQHGFARDVTRRYARLYNAKTRKLRISNIPVFRPWLEKVMKAFQSKYVTETDTMEDAALLKKELSEELPNNIQDFKGHPVFVLERHLKQNEIIQPKVACGQVAIGRSKNSATEPIYRRQDVKTLRSASQWYKLGRLVQVGEQALKHTKRRNPMKHRGFEDDYDGELNEEEETETPLYAEFQTDIYVPPPVVNGKVPKNDFGNLDIFVPSMVPKGAIHMRMREAANAAKLLGIDYADAVCGFDFQSRRSTPRIKGIIVAEEYKEAMMAVYIAMQEQQRFEEDIKRQEEALKRWRRYLIALRVQERVRMNPALRHLEESEAAEKAVQQERQQHSPKILEHVTPDELNGSHEENDEDVGGFIADQDDGDLEGGFLPAANQDQELGDHSNDDVEDQLFEDDDDIYFDE